MENFDLKNLTDEQLKMLQVKISREQESRKEKRKEELIKAFEKAWKNLEEEGFTVHLGDYTDAGEDIYFCDIEVY